jgi:hypothetical protein
MIDKAFSEIFQELAILIKSKGAKYVLHKLRSISSEDYAEIWYEKVKQDACDYFALEPHTIEEKHNKDPNVYAARVVICYVLLKCTTVSQQRMSKLLKKDKGQISKYINFALNLDARDPFQKSIINAIDKLRWHKQ